METNEVVISKLAFRIAQLEVDKAVLQARLDNIETEGKTVPAGETIGGS